ncbi:NmrA family NAD(P)-binding protein [Rhodocytophaga rosea]|uniref:NmrA family NAD(P)-binding protein n=1 Tax=Rhodocytophaga rosea TaxID=2704465 RepID=A0A6C0GGD9_9BACT|nr:NmrA family NAD(P)-binding protein [Rhodocytophaga rosea]QHT66894.1 NmrA family NAD(P)-binding protein [Rhodocytophaga rosea]
MAKIAVIGATGMLGQPVTHELLKAGFEVTVLARNPGNAKTIFGPDIYIVSGDVQHKNSLKSLLAGQDFLYINLSVKQSSGQKHYQPERDGLQVILQEAKRAGIKRIGYLSSLVQRYQGMNGFNWWVFDIKWRAIQAIKEGGIAYSIFYPSTFMESFDKGAYRQGDMIALAGDSKYPMYLISGSDYGKQVVQAFMHNKGNQEYVVQGKEAFTADEAARLFAQHYKKSKIRIAKMPLGILKLLGRFSTKFSYGAHIVEALNQYPEKFESEKTWQELGEPQATFLDYIRASQ